MTAPGREPAPGADGGPVGEDGTVPAADVGDGDDGDVRPPASIDPSDAARDAFAELVFSAVDDLRAALQEPYATQLGQVAFITEDEPPPEKRPPGGTLYGLFEGVPRNRWAADWATSPSTITIYRLPHEWVFRDPVARARAVASTVRHEVAHYFGTDEEGIRAIERESRTGPPR